MIKISSKYLSGLKDYDVRFLTLLNENFIEASCFAKATVNQPPTVQPVWRSGAVFRLDMLDHEEAYGTVEQCLAIHTIRKNEKEAMAARLPRPRYNYSYEDWTELSNDLRRQCKFVLVGEVLWASLLDHMVAMGMHNVSQNRQEIDAVNMKGVTYVPEKIPPRSRSLLNSREIVLLDGPIRMQFTNVTATDAMWHGRAATAMEVDYQVSIEYDTPRVRYVHLMR